MHGAFYGASFKFLGFIWAVHHAVKYWQVFEKCKTRRFWNSVCNNAQTILLIVGIDKKAHLMATCTGCLGKPKKKIYLHYQDYDNFWTFFNFSKNFNFFRKLGIAIFYCACAVPDVNTGLHTPTLRDVQVCLLHFYSNLNRFAAREPSNLDFQSREIARAKRAHVSEVFQPADRTQHVSKY